MKNRGARLPHIIIEHDSSISKKLNLGSMVKDLHTNLASQKTVKLEFLKTRTIEVDNVLIGTGKHNQMIHVNVLLLTGRSTELKEKMSNDLFDIVKDYLDKSEIGMEDCSLSVNVDELGSYRK